MISKEREEYERNKAEYYRIIAIPGLVEQIEAEERVRRDKHLRERNIWQEGWEEGWEEGLKEVREGLKEGRAEGKKIIRIEVAKKMIDSGYNLQEIAKLTGLSEEEISKLKEE